MLSLTSRDVLRTPDSRLVEALGCVHFGTRKAVPAKRKDRHCEHETPPHYSHRRGDRSATLNRWEATPMMDMDPCPVCGGDGRILTSYSSTSCPACHGSGRRSLNTGFHDVTKTKPEHHPPAGDKTAVKKTWPETPQGTSLANEVKATALSEKQKAKLTQSIIDYEERKGQITKTFTRLLRKQIRELS
jgi:hypothetical protein